MRLTLTATLCCVALPLAANAQTIEDARAFVALRATPVGALTPLLTPPMIGRQLNSAQLAIRYGLNEEAGVRTHAVAGTGVFAAGSNSSITITGGVSDADCTDCAPEMLLGVGGDMRVFEMGDVLGAGSSLHIGVSGDLGYSQLKPGNASAISLAVGAPLALSMSGGGASGMRFVPYFTPAFGIGQINDCGASTCNGTRWVMGGGIGVWNPLTSISASLGVNQVLLQGQGQGPVYGINVVFGGR